VNTAVSRGLTAHLQGWVVDWGAQLCNAEKERNEPLLFRLIKQIAEKDVVFATDLINLALNFQFNQIIALTSSLINPNA
jgi:hypothetical protein